MAEVDYLLALDDTGVVVHEEEAAQLNNVTEWLHTAEGEVFGMPWWGHVFNRYKHEVLDEDTLLAIENSTVLKMQRDMPLVRINAVRSRLLSIDSAIIELHTNYGVVSRNL